MSSWSDVSLRRVLPLTLSLAWERIRSTARLPWAHVGVAVLIVSTITAITAGTQDIADQHEHYISAVQDRLLSQLRPPGLASGRAVEPGVAVLRPPNPAIALVGGPASGLPAAWAMAPAGAEAAAPYIFSRSRQGVQWTLVPEVVLRLFGALFSLFLAVWLTVTDVTRSWPMVSSGWSLPRNAIILADILGDAAVSGLVVAAWFGSVAGYLLMFSGPAVPSGIFVDWLSLAPLAWLYLVTFAWIGSSVAYSCQSPRRALVASATAWVLLTLVVPQALPAVVAWNATLPSPAQFERTRREIYADHLRQLDIGLSHAVSARLGNTESSMDRTAFARAGFARLEDAWRRGMDAARVVTRDMEREYRVQITRQRRAASRIGSLTPGTAFSVAAAEVAGSGLAYVDAWEHAVQDYKQRLDEAVFDDRPLVNLIITAGGHTELVAIPRRPPPRLVDLPAFEPPNLGRRERLQRAAGDAIPVVIHAFLALLLGAAAHRRELERYRRFVTPAPGATRRL